MKGLKKWLTVIAAVTVLVEGLAVTGVVPPLAAPISGAVRAAVGVLAEPGALPVAAVGKPSRFA